MTAPPSPPLDSDPVDPHSPWRIVRALGEPNYRNYFFGQGISLMGTWMQTAALNWVAFSLTGQSRLPAWVNAALLLPSVAVGPIAGRFLDRLPKKRVIVTTQALLCLMAFLLGVVAWFRLIHPYFLFAWAILAGVIMGLDLPARLSYLVDLAGRNNLPNAVALNSFQFNLARAVGPALTAQVLLLLDVSWCFFLNALSYLAVIVAIWGNNAPGLPHPKSTQEGGNQKEKVPLTTWEMVFLSGLVSGLGWPVLSLIPAYASKVLQGGPETYANLVGGIGVGALGACVLVAMERSASQRENRMTLALLSAAIGLLGLSGFTRFEMSLLASPLIGLGMVGFLATAQTLVQMGAPPRRRGLVLGIWTGVLSGSLPLGNFLAGPLADAWGVERVLAWMGLGILGALALHKALSWFAPYRKAPDF